MLRQLTDAGMRATARASALTYERLDSVTQGWLVVTSGSVARLGLGFIASIIIARALGPAAFGVYSVLAAVAAFGGVATDLGLTNAAVRRVAAAWPDDHDRVGDLWRSFFWFRILVVGGAVGLGVLVAGTVSPVFLDVGNGDLYLRLALIGILATALSGSVTGMLQATGRFGRLSAVLMVNSGLTVLLALILARAGMLNVTTALLILGIGTSLVSLGLAYRLLPGSWPLTPPDRETFTRNAGDLTRFGVWLWVGSIFSTLALYLDVLIVNNWAAPAAVGVYALAVNLTVKVEVVNQSLYTVLLPTASALRDREDVRSYIRRGLLRSGLIAAALLPFIFLARPLIVLFYGEAYGGAAGLFQGLLGVAMLNVVLTPLLMLAFTYDRPRLIALADGTRALTLLAVALALVPMVGSIGAVVAKLAAALAGGVVILIFIVRQLDSTGQLPVEPDESVDG